MSDLGQEFVLHHQFLEQARRSPEKTALVEGNRSMSYAELDSRTRIAAAALLARGVTPHSIVGLHVERSIDWVIGVLAILRANAVVLPIPPTYPPARLRSISTHAELRAVIDNASTPLAASTGQQGLDLAELCSDGGGRAADAAAVEGRSDQAAFVLCSSGSTGIPKMIVRSHGSFFHRLTWTWTQHPYVAGEVCCHKAHTTTTHGIYELFEPLLRGVPVVILPDEQTRDLEKFWRTVTSFEVSRLLLVPSVMQASLDIPGFSPPVLRVVVLMGERLQQKLAQRIVKAFPEPTALYSIYGSTEASSILVCNLRECVTEEDELFLGQPITRDMGVHVLGQDLRPVAPGQVGRLHVSGPALFTGYFNDPRLTSEAVLTDPHSGVRLYNTGDEVRYMPGGDLQFVGRARDTVKVRGFRIELPEVERAMRLHPQVSQAAVVASETDGAETTLTGFFTPATVTARDVYRILRDRLPPYMIPSRLIGLETFPLTERGKLDLARLIQEGHARTSGTSDTRAMSDVEGQVAMVWEDTLGHRLFDVTSSFFEVGGTSLTTFVLVHRLRNAFGLDSARLPVELAYQYPTVEAMARHLSGAKTRDSSKPRRTSLLVTLRKALDTSVAPLFVIASAGGTVGAYGKLAATLRFRGEIVGVRDPYIAGERDPTEDFQRWVGRYKDAVRKRHGGPYYIVAYSSAGAFGYELARQLRLRDAQVGLLTLIDPLGIGAGSRRRFGWWAWHATESRPRLRTLVRLAGRLRAAAGGVLHAHARADARFALSASEFQQLARRIVRAEQHLKALAALMELNTGLPLDLSDSPLLEHSPRNVLEALKARIAELLPEVDGETIERIAVQYPLQLQAHRAYELQPYDSPVLLVEPSTRYAGLLEAVLKPHVKKMRAVRLELGAPDPRVRSLTARFGELEPHFRSMRDDRFTQSLAREIDAALEEATNESLRSDASLDTSITARTQ